MHSQQVRASRFLGCDMIDIGSGDAESTCRCWSTTGALTAWLDRTKVFGVASIPQVENAIIGDGIAKALVLSATRTQKRWGVSQLSLLATRSRTCLHREQLKQPNLQDNPIWIRNLFRYWKERQHTTPMTYRGFFSGSSPVHVSTTLQYASFSSPPDKPPMAMPGVSLATISAVHCLLRSKSSPPCMMQNRFCLSGYLCACMQRSSQRTERSMASFIRARSGEVVAMTSSSCIIISEPMEFWREMECSGVRSIGDPSWGLRKRTPSSVTLASFSSDTIWKLVLVLVSAAARWSTRWRGSPTHHYLQQSAPLLPPKYNRQRLAPVRMLCGHDWSLCAPPIASSVAWPGLSPLPHVSSSRCKNGLRAAQMVCIV